MIRKDFINRKISLIQDDLARLVELSRYTLDEIATDFIKQGALERMLERIITRAIDINNHIISELANKDTSPPKDYQDSYLQLAKFGIYPKEFAKEIAKSVGTRNILVHEYDKIDPDKIYNSIADCLRDYNKYCGYVFEFVKKIRLKKKNNK